MIRDKIEGFMIGLAGGILFAYFVKLPEEATRPTPNAGREVPAKRSPQPIRGVKPDSISMGA